MNQKQLNKKTIEQESQIATLQTTISTFKEQVSKERDQTIQRWADRFNNMDERMKKLEGQTELVLKISNNMEVLQKDLLKMQSQFGAMQENFQKMQASVVKVEDVLTEMMVDKKATKNTFRNGVITAVISLGFGVLLAIITQYFL